MRRPGRSATRVLFLSTNNSVRSQMAEGILRDRTGGRFEVASAGAGATNLHPLAVAVVKELGIDISAQTPKTRDRYLGEHWDYVITICNLASEPCPIFPGRAHRIHWGIDNPLAEAGSEEELLARFRRVRDEILDRIRMFETFTERQEKLLSSSLASSR